MGWFLALVGESTIESAHRDPIDRAGKACVTPAHIFLWQLQGLVQGHRQGKVARTFQSLD